MSTKKTWLVVGDGAKAQFYSLHAVPLRLTKVSAGILKATRKLTHGAEHKTDGRHNTLIGIGHGDHQRHENVFVEHIAEALAAAVSHGVVDAIILVLPPKALAHFRKIAAPDVQKRIKQEICGEWTHLQMPDLEQHLAAALP